MYLLNDINPSILLEEKILDTSQLDMNSINHLKESKALQCTKLQYVKYFLSMLSLERLRSNKASQQIWNTWKVYNKEVWIVLLPLIFVLIGISSLILKEVKRENLVQRIGDTFWIYIR